MTQAVARVHFSWDPSFTACRAAAYDVRDRALGQVVVELADDTRQRIWAQRGPNAHLRIEEIAEKQLRAMLELRH